MLSLTLLERLSQDHRLPPSSRESFARSAQLSRSRFFGAGISFAPDRSRVSVSDCKGSEELPGIEIDLSSTVDATAKRVEETAQKLLFFFSSVLCRNSIDNRGCAVESSIHYSRGYCNASWSGSRMVYGDGDGYMFTDFTTSPDFIVHEIFHGVTACECNLGYDDEYGALNESVSDVFGSVFRQWFRGETAENASWLIGEDLLTDQGRSMGWEAIRDMANPEAAHCISPQARHYSKYAPGGDPHYNSGIPNFAFYSAAVEIGGHAWEKVGLIWYRTLCSPRIGSKCDFATFARQTVCEARHIFPHEAALPSVIAGGWQQAGVSAT